MIRFTKRILKQSLVAATLFIAASSGADAGSLVLRFGLDDVSDKTNTRAPILSADIYGKAIWSHGTFRVEPGLVLSADSDGDTFVGVALRGVVDLNDNWFLEGSFAPGYYSQGTGGTPLDNDIQFRSLIGVNFRLNDVSGIGLAVSHMSNASQGPTNPGSNQVWLQYFRDF